MKKPKACHHLIKKTAVELAGTFYDKRAHDNTFYHFYPTEKFFIDTEWYQFITMAKSMLVSMLGRPDICEAMKEEIFEALCLDKLLPKSGTPIEAIGTRH
jgi:hypothetical protein